MTRFRFLAVLFLLLCIAIIYAWNATPRQKRITREFPAKQDGKVVAPLKAEQPEDDPERVASTHAATRTARRNLFAPLRKIEKNTEPPVTTPVIKPRPQPLPVQPRESVQPVFDPFPNIKVLGELEKGEEKIVFLQLDSGEIFLVKDEDLFGEGLKVYEIKAKQIVIVHEQSGKKKSFPLGEIKNQRVSLKGSPSGREDVENPQHHGTSVGGPVIPGSTSAPDKMPLHQKK